MSVISHSVLDDPVHPPTDGNVVPRPGIRLRSRAARGVTEGEDAQASSGTPTSAPPSSVIRAPIRVKVGVVMNPPAKSASP